MKFGIYKNLRYRQEFVARELPNRVDKFIFNHFLNHPDFKDKPLARILASNTDRMRHGSKVKIPPKCMLTGHSKSVYTKVGLARMPFRMLAREGRLPGFEKHVW